MKRLFQNVGKILLAPTIAVLGVPALAAADANIFYKKNLPPHKAQYILVHQGKQQDAILDCDCKERKLVFKGIYHDGRVNRNGEQVLAKVYVSNFVPELKRVSTDLVELTKNNDAKAGGNLIWVVQEDIPNGLSFNNFCQPNGNVRPPADRGLYQAMESTWQQLIR